MTTPRHDHRRTRRRATAQPLSDELARALARRDELDAATAEDRDREAELVAEYFSTVAEEADIRARHDAALAELDDRRRAIADDADQAVAVTEKRRAAVVTALNKRRSVQHLVTMLGQPRRRIDKLIRLHTGQDAPQKTVPSDREMAPGSDGADPAADSTADRSPSTTAHPPRPPEPSAEPASATAPAPEAALPADHPSDGRPTDPLVETGEPASVDDLDRLF